MPKFTVTTWEHVEGSYVVEAATAAEAQAAFEADPRRVGEQRDYQAFAIEVQRVEDYDDWAEGDANEAWGDSIGGDPAEFSGSTRSPEPFAPAGAQQNDRPSGQGGGSA